MPGVGHDSPVVHNGASNFGGTARGAAFVVLETRIVLKYAADYGAELTGVGAGTYEDDS